MRNFHEYPGLDNPFLILDLPESLVESSKAILDSLVESELDGGQLSNA